MKNTLKFNVGVRLVLAIVLCLSTKAHASAASDRVFVLACDEYYAGPTAAAIQSLKENNPFKKKVVTFTRGLKPESRDKLERMANSATSIFVIDLDEERWKNMPTFGGGTIDLIASIKGIGKGHWGDVTFKNEQDGSDIYKFWINLRFFFPEIFASGFLPEELGNIDSFLWLDSDLIVLKGLSELFKICEEHPNQLMIGANLRDPSGFDSILGSGQKVSKADMSRAIFRQCVGIYDSNTYIISGGVVFWRIKKIIEDCNSIGKNVFQKAFFELNNMAYKWEKTHYTYSSEEFIFTHYSYKSFFWKDISEEDISEEDTPEEDTPEEDISEENTPEEDTSEQLYFVSSLFNMANPELLQEGHVKEEDVAIFHWDSLKKPWDAKKRTMTFFLKNDSGGFTTFSPEDPNDGPTEVFKKLWQEFASRTEFYN
jgi:hypothetical protein